MTEHWRCVPGWDGYEISTLGRVRSVDRVITRSNGVPYRVRGRVLKTCRVKHGNHVEVVGLARLGETRSTTVAALMRETFGEGNAA